MEGQMKRIFLVLLAVAFVAVDASGSLIAQTSDVKGGKPTNQGGAPKVGSQTISVQLAGDKAKPPQKPASSGETPSGNSRKTR
jgi:hypothetical protein